MRDEHNRSVIRLADTTDHGGTVKTAFEGLRVHDRPVAGEGCLVWCPRCKGDFAILPSSSGRRHHGRTIAYEGDLTACGARLIASFVG
ncbi:PAAR domain-containing protein [Variovorax ginsengisoli]|uniref:Zn-binding protein involved in type VI secretion n=1 Tax=Variovorax ginsengisoli TaxID=363844 RepID=A0ABT9SFE2_9BURK|nr:PAAR domain-containing protein [Variovorax ginsengisoli]MDP9902508.1 putative Zn-binding protein involved in type VI secretion [Variovorax ginsengisoli]